jgi:hypothetical protein
VYALNRDPEYWTRCSFEKEGDPLVEARAVPRCVDGQLLVPPSYDDQRSVRISTRKRGRMYCTFQFFLEKARGSPLYSYSIDVLSSAITSCYVDPLCEGYADNVGGIHSASVVVAAVATDDLPADLVEGGLRYSLDIVLKERLYYGWSEISDGLLGGLLEKEGDQTFVAVVCCAADR